MKPTSEAIEKSRTFWVDVAKKHGWYSEPFYVVVWHDENGDIVDSVSHRDMDSDHIILNEND